MFRKEFADVISKTGMVPIKDLRPLLTDNKAYKISEFGLLDFDFFDDIKFAKQLSENYKILFIDLQKAKVRNEVITLIKKKDVAKYRAIPIQKSKNSIVVTIFDPTVVEMKNEIQTILQGSVEFILTNISSWKKLYGKIQETIDELLETVREIKPEQKEDKQEVIKEEDIGDDVIRYVNRILADSFVKKASDIHIEPYEKKFRIRFRVDGKLMEIEDPPKKFMLPMISRIKIMAQIDIAEKRKPQDGRIKLSIGGKVIDYRVSSLPTLFGEKIVMRLLDTTNLELDMTNLGLEKNQIVTFKGGIKRPFGMCLVTGPTGSGKTTTLYSALNELNQTTTNISTVEDPVEFNLEGINQVNVRNSAGLTFASSLRAFLRQDPDIIMVGEIRDTEVAEIAVEAALTGHLVLSTLHTNDASSSVIRLLNMGIEPFLVTGAVNIVVAQRLCRKICLECRKEEKTHIRELVACGFSPKSAGKIKTYIGVGCNACNGTGYKGRVAIYEVLEMSSSLKELVLRNVSNSVLKLQAIKEGMKTLRMCALTKVAQGIITLNEAIMNSESDRSPERETHG